MESLALPSENTVILDLGEGIIIRQYQDTDVSSFARHANNINIWKNLRDRFPQPHTEIESLKWITICRQPESLVASGAWTAEQGSSGPLIPAHYAISVNGEAVGSIGLMFGEDIYSRTAEIGYWLSESFWGQGIMSRIVPAFIKWSFETFGVLVRLNAEVVEGNLGSEEVLKKAGFVFEGRRVNHSWKRGFLQTSLMFGALRPSVPEVV